MHAVFYNGIAIVVLAFCLGMFVIHTIQQQKEIDGLKKRLGEE